MSSPAFEAFAHDKAGLSGGVSLYLSSPRAEFLRGNYLSVNWDVVELEKYKVEFVEKRLGKLGFLQGTGESGEVGVGGFEWGK